MKSASSIFGLCALFTITTFIITPTQVWAKSYINKNWRGSAIKGYDPVEGWKIVNGSLYSNSSREIPEKNGKNIPSYIKNADKNWPDVLD